MAKNRWIYLVFTGVLSVTVLEEDINDEAIIRCPLADVEYPTWTGPSTLTTPLTNGKIINEQGIAWIDKKDLKILSLGLKHSGHYSCSGGVEVKTIELVVVQVLEFYSEEERNE
ncbi:uncharacterized protein LOC128546262 isoform X2 [Mercenaria mercenaria]|uniref:uncharacterized protein LOC128546262 isoform X2 n=1 Tax=Mercenaria mercenaria TaxID=6596 RepID=UPI00234EF900|nr:uncharacterized protein LOC128546262 isoform X2 [Mercenaria mercenaria]